MTDKQLLSTVRSRVTALRKQNLTGTDAYAVFQSMVRTFNAKHGYKDTNIHFNKKMSTIERREMRSILRAFYRNPESTKTGILKRLKSLSRSTKKTVELSKLSGEQITNLLKSFDGIKSSKTNWVYDVFGGEVTKYVMYNARANGMESEDVFLVLRDVVSVFDYQDVSPERLTNNIIDLLGHYRRGETNEYKELLNDISS